MFMYHKTLEYCRKYFTKEEYEARLQIPMPTTDEEYLKLCELHGNLPAMPEVVLMEVKKEFFHRYLLSYSKF